MQQPVKTDGVSKGIGLFAFLCLVVPSVVILGFVLPSISIPAQRNALMLGIGICLAIGAMLQVVVGALEKRSAEDSNSTSAIPEDTAPTH